MHSLEAVIQILKRDYDSVEAVRKEDATYIEINRTLLSLEEAEEVANGERSLLSIVASRPNRTS